MRYRTPEAFRAALEQRLKNESATNSVAVMRLRKRVAFERFLARLSATDATGWMLKGAFALELRLGLGTRTTKDIDLARADDEEAATEHLNAAAAVDLGDFFSFEVRRTPALDAAAGFHAVRYTARADLAGRRFEQFPVDVALGERSQGQPDLLSSPDLLAFAEIAAPELPVVPLEQHIAEKLHAYTGTYGPSERPSTRPKDLVDILLIAGSEEIETSALHSALTTTFEARNRQPLPAKLPAPPQGWEEPYRRLAEEIGIEPDLEAAFIRGAAFLDPVLAGHIKGRWDARAGAWTAPSKDAK